MPPAFTPLPEPRQCEACLCAVCLRRPPVGGLPGASDVVRCPNLAYFTPRDSHVALCKVCADRRSP